MLMISSNARTQASASQKAGSVTVTMTAATNPTKRTAVSAVYSLLKA